MRRSRIRIRETTEYRVLVLLHIHNKIAPNNLRNFEKGSALDFLSRSLNIMVQRRLIKFTEKQTLRWPGEFCEITHKGEKRLEELKIKIRSLKTNAIA